MSTPQDCVVTVWVSTKLPIVFPLEIPNVPLPAHDAIKIGIEGKKSVAEALRIPYIQFGWGLPSIMRYQRMLKSEVAFPHLSCRGSTWVQQHPAVRSLEVGSPGSCSQPWLLVLEKENIGGVSGYTAGTQK